MKRYPIIGAALLIGWACAQQTPQSSLTTPTALSGSPADTSSRQTNFTAHLSGGEVVPPTETPAQGEAIFHLSPDGAELTYKVIVAKIDNVIGAHVHLNSGPLAPVALLFGPVDPGGGRVDGVLADGTLTAADLRGALLGQPLSALIDAIEADTVYVDIPTNDGIFPPNTGRGDFFFGEIRGAVR